jgi:hypothetical protein
MEIEKKKIETAKRLLDVFCFSIEGFAVRLRGSFFYYQLVFTMLEAYFDRDRFGASLGFGEVLEWKHAIFCEVQW